MKDHVVVDTDKGRLNVYVIHGFLTNAYWSLCIPRETVQRAIANSLCFGVYVEGEQTGFARAVTDYAVETYNPGVYQR